MMAVGKMGNKQSLAHREKRQGNEPKHVSGTLHELVETVAGLVLEAADDSAANPDLALFLRDFGHKIKNKYQYDTIDYTERFRQTILGLIENQVDNKVGYLTNNTEQFDKMSEKLYIDLKNSTSEVLQNNHLELSVSVIERECRRLARIFSGIEPEKASEDEMKPQTRHEEKDERAYSAADPIIAPKTWEEAKAEVPGLMRWAEAKAAALAERRDITFLDHLRDVTHGYGRWALTERGLPRGRLKTWGDTAGYELVRRAELPSDLHVPKREPEVIEGPVTAERLRAAYRLVKQAERTRQR